MGKKSIVGRGGFFLAGRGQEGFQFWICQGGFFVFVFKFLFIFWLHLHCCTQAFSSCGERGLLFVVVRRLLVVVASFVAEHGLQVHGLQQLWPAGSVVVARGLQSTGSVVVVHELSCSMACEIFPDQGSEPVSPALAGGFLTTVPPGKSSVLGLRYLLDIQVERSNGLLDI